ncbi:hypothetical protein AYI69_g1943 [Smittium culicis]|uniref:Uncharacterized protein n=1 Tax=Smittium culicis TaxID=133412 RepID=A0A1R1YP09_9FUNG|nr:hypothetical protein AYI69_g1943 [Smittium culicis]
MYEEIREGGRSVLAGATKTLEEETSTAGNHQVIGSYVEMLGRKRKRGTEVDEGARHKLTKHDLFVVIGSLVHNSPIKCTSSNSKLAVEASENGDEVQANLNKSELFVFIENDVEFIKKKKLDLVRETGVKTCIIISSDPDSLSVCEMIDERDVPGVYQTMRRNDFRGSVGERSTSQIILGQRLEYFEMLRILRPKVVIVQETFDKRDDWAVTIPGYEIIHYCAREGSNHGVLIGIYKSHVAQRIPGIEGKLVVVQAQLNEQSVKFGSFYLP